MENIKSKYQQWGSQWLNSTGILVLLKYVLSCLPIFQFSSLLAHAVELNPRFFKNFDTFFGKWENPIVKILSGQLAYYKGFEITQRFSDQIFGQF